MKFDRSLLEFRPPHSHYYDGKRLLGVTTALSSISKGDGLTQWAVNQALDYVRGQFCPPEVQPPDEYFDPVSREGLETVLLGAKQAWRYARERAASIGTQTHNWIEAYLKGEDPSWPADPAVQNSCSAALDWIKAHKWETIKVEHQIYIPELGVGGICDWYARIDGVLAVPDWKTSKSLHSEYAYQTAAYLRALEGEFDEEIPHRWLIRIDKDTGSVEPLLLPQENISKDYAAFESAVTIYRREAELKKWITGNGSWT